MSAKTRPLIFDVFLEFNLVEQIDPTGVCHDFSRFLTIVDLSHRLGICFSTSSP
ncbi:hypothetical protein [Gimesia maris]|uniref:hypothetical protein n=1 Tax=Gimesia maris TaxID=122 RepID=UPI0018D6F421|nr:hypothetical protein [Gimesia maris]